MDDTKFINTKSFEITSTIDGYFLTDRIISKTIAKLNELGYKTKASCSGHHKIEFLEIKNCEIQYLQELQNNPRCIIKEVRKMEFDYWTEILGTSIYILFDKNYDFEMLPQGFKLNDGRHLSYEVEYYDNFQKRKSEEEIIKEIKKHNKILENWANNLPKVKKGD